MHVSKTRKGVVSLGVCAVLLNACASSPDSMTPADVSPLKYQSYECSQIGAEGDRVSRKVTALHDNLKKKADNDAWQMGVGLILVWPLLFALEGGDGPDATEYKQLKGEYDALQQAATQHKCGLSFPSFADTVKAVSKKAEGNSAAKRGDPAPVAY